MMQHRGLTITSLGIAQTLAWASSYYLPAMLAGSMARELGIGTPTVFLGFSLALVVSALLGPLAGKLIDRYGGRPVLAGRAQCHQGADRSAVPAPERQPLVSRRPVRRARVVVVGD